MKEKRRRFNVTILASSNETRAIHRIAMENRGFTMNVSLGLWHMRPKDKDRFKIIVRNK